MLSTRIKYAHRIGLRHMRPLVTSFFDGFLCFCFFSASHAGPDRYALLLPRGMFRCLGSTLWGTWVPVTVLAFLVFGVQMAVLRRGYLYHVLSI